MSHDTLRDLAATLCFAVFVAGAAWSAPRRELDVRARRRATIFTVWLLCASMGIGMLERDLYPFTSWPLISWLYPKSYPLRRYVAVDAAGKEHDVDYRAWQPLSEDELASWMGTRFLQLGPAERDSVARDLLRRANVAAKRVANAQPIGTYERRLGPLSAPLFHLHPRVWNSADDVPALPFRALRLYVETWDPDNGPRATANVPRSLLYEYAVR